MHFSLLFSYISYIFDKIFNLLFVINKVLCPSFIGRLTDSPRSIAVRQRAFAVRQRAFAVRVKCRLHLYRLGSTAVKIIRWYLIFLAAPEEKEQQQLNTRTCTVDTLATINTTNTQTLKYHVEN